MAIERHSRSSSPLTWYGTRTPTRMPPTNSGDGNAFFAVADKPREMFASWEVIPYAVLGNDKIAFSHQIDRVVFPDGRKQEVRFNLYMEFNEQGQLREVWEFGQTAFV